MKANELTQPKTRAGAIEIGRFCSDCRTATHFADRPRGRLHRQHIHRGIKNVTVNEPFFPGHFPGAPVMPGVLQIEALAQTGALLMSKTLEADISKHLILFMSVENARFKKPVMPGDVMEMPVEVLFQRRNIFKFRGRVEVRGELVTDCEFAAMKADRP